MSVAVTMPAAKRRRRRARRATQQTTMPMQASTMAMGAGPGVRRSASGECCTRSTVKRMTCSRSAVRAAGRIATHALRSDARKVTMAMQSRAESSGISMKLRGRASTVVRWK